MRELIFDKVTDGNIVYMDMMEIILGSTHRGTMIDLGCHKAAHTPLFKFKERKYVDLIKNTLDFPEEQQFFEVGDILDTPLDKRYNVAFSLDVIEHLTITNGAKLLNIMNTISDKRVLFTPLDDLFGMDLETDNPESHRSLWKPEIIEELFPNQFIFVTFPNYHKVWDGGAFFFYSLDGDIDKEFNRITNEINKFSWAK
jgi:hypothetical protein